MREPAAYIVRSHRAEGVSDSGEQSPGCACFEGAQEGFHLRPHLLDGVEVWAVRGQEQNLNSGRVDRGLYRHHFVRREIVQDHDVSDVQAGGKNVLDIGREHLRVRPARASEGYHKVGRLAIGCQRFGTTIPWLYGHELTRKHQDTTGLGC